MAPAQRWQRDLTSSAISREAPRSVVGRSSNGVNDLQGAGPPRWAWPAGLRRDLALILGAFGYALPYFAPLVWWRFAPGTLVILAAGSYASGGDVRGFLGLRVGIRALVGSFAVFFVALALSDYVLSEVVGTQIDITRYQTWTSHAHQFFQVLNDELVMRAALLTVVLSALSYPRIAILALAGTFAMLHAGLYRGQIHAPALVTLFSFGVVANALFLAVRHIAFGLALHYAWNFYRFGAWYRLEGRLLSDAETFNCVEGNPWVVAGSAALAIFAFGAYSTWGDAAAPHLEHRDEPDDE